MKECNNSHENLHTLAVYLFFVTTIMAQLLPRKTQYGGSTPSFPKVWPHFKVTLDKTPEPLVPIQLLQVDL